MRKYLYKKYGMKYFDINDYFQQKPTTGHLCQVLCISLKYAHSFEIVDTINLHPETVAKMILLHSKSLEENRFDTEITNLYQSQQIADLIEEWLSTANETYQIQKQL